VRSAGVGVDVRIVGTRLLKPLTLKYWIGRGIGHLVPIVLHDGGNGRWNVVRGHRLPSGWFVVHTRHFSPNILAWLGHLVSDVKQWTSDVTHWVASGVGGRTSPLTCGKSAPGWFSYVKQSDLIHTCSITNSGRAEIQLKSNRGITEDIHIPGNPAYVWVDGQSGGVRGLLSRVGIDPSHEVLLGPGQWMTVGYAQPAATLDGSFEIADDTGWAYLDDVLRASLDTIVGDSLDDHHKGLLLVYTEAQCGANFNLSASGNNLSPATIGGFLGCMFQNLPGQLTDPAALQRLGLDKADADTLVEAGKGLGAIAAVVNFYPLFQATALHDIDDSLRSLLKHGNDKVTVHMTGGGQAPASPGGSGQGPQGTPSPGSGSPSLPLPQGDFTVMNAAGGIYWRSAPDWNTAEATAGNGFYPGTVISVSCYQAGAANVPGTTDGMWEQASWVSGPGGGSGWINEHFINDGAAINQPSAGIPACPSQSSPSPPPQQPTTWAETTGGVAHTWTNYTNAGGTQGPSIAGGQTVAIACKLPGFRVADGNTWWYRIASSPWNGNFYVSADAFYNNGATSGSLHGTPFVDPAVANC
jgi:hypothetical protein